MREWLEFVISLIAAELTSFYVVTYVLKETEMLRFICATALISFVLFAFIMWLFEIAHIREKRKQKKRKKSIDELSLE
jgi:hypothetical protein